MIFLKCKFLSLKGEKKGLYRKLWKLSVTVIGKNLLKREKKGKKNQNMIFLFTAHCRAASFWAAVSCLLTHNQNRLHTGCFSVNAPSVSADEIILWYKYHGTCWLFFPVCKSTTLCVFAWNGVMDKNANATWHIFWFLFKSLPIAVTEIRASRTTIYIKICEKWNSQCTISQKAHKQPCWCRCDEGQYCRYDNEVISVTV